MLPCSVRHGKHSVRQQPVDARGGQHHQRHELWNTQPCATGGLEPGRHQRSSGGSTSSSGCGRGEQLCSAPSEEVGLRALQHCCCCAAQSRSCTAQMSWSGTQAAGQQDHPLQMYCPLAAKPILTKLPAGSHLLRILTGGHACAVCLRPA